MTQFLYRDGGFHAKRSGTAWGSLVLLIHTSKSFAGDRRPYQPSQIDWLTNGAIPNSVVISGALTLRIWTCRVMLLEKARECLGRKFPISDEELAESISQFEMIGKLAFELVEAGCYEGQ